MIRNKNCEYYKRILNLQQNRKESAVTTTSACVSIITLGICVSDSMDTLAIIVLNPEMLLIHTPFLLCIQTHTHTKLSDDKHSVAIFSSFFFTFHSIVNYSNFVFKIKWLATHEAKLRRCSDSKRPRMKCERKNKHAKCVAFCFATGSTENELNVCNRYVLVVKWMGIAQQPVNVISIALLYNRRKGATRA